MNRQKALGYKQGCRTQKYRVYLHIFLEECFGRAFGVKIMRSDEDKLIKKMDHRYFPRWKVKNRIVYRLDNDPTVYKVVTRDLSCTGICFLTQKPIGFGQRVHLRIYLLKHRSTYVEGLPVWSQKTPQGYYVGVRFLTDNIQLLDTILQAAFEIPQEDVA